MRVLGTPRTVTSRERSRRLGRERAALGGCSPRRPAGCAPARDEVDAVVDAELGILLRCAKRSGDERLLSPSSPRSTWARPATPPVQRPGGQRVRRRQGRRGGQARGRPGHGGPSLGDAVGEAPGAAGKEAAKAVAGMAAGGLGALIKYGPKGRRVDPFTQAASEAADPEAAMPTDERSPEGLRRPEAGALADEVLHLVYRSGLGAPSLRATLHQWADFDALIAAVPQSARGTGFGGVGFLLDVMRDATQGSGGRHLPRREHGCDGRLERVPDRRRPVDGERGTSSLALRRSPQ